MRATVNESYGTDRPAVPTRVAEILLIRAIFLGSLVLWIGVPLAWIWGASQVVEDYPAVYALAIVGCPATMVVWGWVLHRINAVYMGLRGAAEDQPANQRAAWLKSLSADRSAPRRGLDVLEICSIISVAIALVAIAVWFFFFAEMHLAPL